MSLKNTLYKMFESNEGGSLSCARVMTWTCGLIGMVLMILHFFGIGQNVDTAYTLLGVGFGGGVMKSITSQPKVEKIVIAEEEGVKDAEPESDEVIA